VFPKRLRAVSSDVTIELSKRELQLLVLLIENQGEVVTREEIFRVGWGYDRIPNSRTLDQMVSQLRARIESDPKNPTLIQTVYGVGYRYDED
jgi:DNA-binding response OmpR family regulator